MSDALIWLAYVAIPLLLFEFSRRRPDLPFRWIFWVFGAFIVGCGLTHLMEVVTMYVPMYRFSAIVKLATALVSLATVVALVRLLPIARSLRGARELEEEVQERRWISELLRQSEERFRLLVEGTTDYAIFMLDTKGHVVSWNAGAERIFGYRADEIIGQHFSRFY